MRPGASYEACTVVTVATCKLLTASVSEPDLRFAATCTAGMFRVRLADARGEELGTTRDQEAVRMRAGNQTSASARATSACSKHAAGARTVPAPTCPTPACRWA